MLRSDEHVEKIRIQKKSLFKKMIFDVQMNLKLRPWIESELSTFDPFTLDFIKKIQTSSRFDPKITFNN